METLRECFVRHFCNANCVKNKNGTCTNGIMVLPENEAHMRSVMCLDYEQEVEQDENQVLTGTDN